MARRGMAGQLNMFDFFSSLDAGTPGEVEMVSLMPSLEEEPESVKEEPEVEEISEVEGVLETEAIGEVPVAVVEQFEEDEEELEPKVEQKVVVLDKEMVAMSRIYEQAGKKIEIAYINYNKVRITRGDEAPILKEFASTKEAVDYYVEQMQELEADE